jgi:hypothetical protein
MNDADPYLLLIQRYLDHEIDAAGMKALGDWIVSDPTHARCFMLFVSLHRQLGDAYKARLRLSEHSRTLTESGGTIQDSLAINDALEMLMEAEESAHPPLAILPDKVPAPHVHPAAKAPAKPEVYRPLVIPWWVVITSGAVAAALAIALILPFFDKPSSGPGPVTQGPPSQPEAWTATVVGRAHASGDKRLCSYQIGDPMAGLIELGDETIEFRLSSGVTVVAMGPLKGTLLSQREIDLQRGRVVVDVGGGVGGFVVTAGDAVFRDIGTVFGVSRTDVDHGEVVVLQGEVVAEMVTPAGGVARRNMRGGEAARVSDRRDGFEAVAFAQHEYPRSALAAAGLYRERLIKSETMAFWRFEAPEVPPGVFPFTNLGARDYSIAVPDVSGNQNHLYHSQPNGRSEARAVASTAPMRPSVTGGNQQSAFFSLIPDGEVCDLHTWSVHSRPAGPVNIEQPGWEQLTIECSFRAETLDGARAIVGLDGTFTQAGNTVPAFACEVVDGHLRVAGVDSKNRYRVVRSPQPADLGVWTHVAVVFDGGTMRVYVKQDGVPGGYQVVGETPFEGSIRVPGPRAWDGFPHTWTVGRGIFNGKMQRAFHGYIDEVRLCKLALEPRDFLFAVPEE